MATQPLPKWLMLRYAKLWKNFGDKEFEFEDALQILNEKDENTVSVTLSQLRKHGWLLAKLHPYDSRKRIYQLKNPEEAIRNME